MSESDANRAMNDTARMRLQPDTCEDTQRMPVADRRGRQHEGRMMHEAARGEGHARAMLNNPVYRNQEIAAGLREWQWREPFERLPVTQTEIYEQCYAAYRRKR
jgi:hypothetical protein